MLHKFGSNLDFKPSGNLVNMMNSARGRHLISGELLIRSGRRRGRPWLRTGAVKALRGFSLLPGRPLKLVPSPFFSFLLLCFPTAAAIAQSSLHRLLSAFTSSAKVATAPLVPCALTIPVQVA